MTITKEKLRDTILADTQELGVHDEQSIHILAIGRVAQATLAAEVERMTADGAPSEQVEAYRAERSAQLDRWMRIQCEAVRSRAIVCDEVARCLG